MKSADSSALEVCKLIIIDYSPNKQKMSVGLLKGKNVFVANAACQPQFGISKACFCLKIVSIKAQKEDCFLYIYC